MDGKLGDINRMNFNSRTSCEVRPKRLRGQIVPRLISTHAPLARCDKRRENHETDI